MARFTIAKKTPRDNGWADHLAAEAMKLDPDFDPLLTSHHEFIEALVEHHLNEIKTLTRTN
ncbi:hypothetical protein OAA10_00305 [bacterium]|nr:hypothetical protein [bacterium]